MLKMALLDCAIIEKRCSVDGGQGVCPLFSSPPRGVGQLKSPHPWQFAIQGKKNAHAWGSAQIDWCTSSLFIPCFVAHNKELQLFLIFNRSMSSSEAKTLRVCANSFLDHLSLVVETIEAFGPPLEESWLCHIPLLLINCEHLNSL